MIDKKVVRMALLGAAMVCCGQASAAYADTFTGGRTDFRDEAIYFAMTTRFYDGDPSNNTYCWDGSLNVNDPEWRGDFKGLIEKLDYIKALGFTAVWITPVVENASGLDYHGYHALNFSKVDPRYESDDAKFQDLIDAAHERGMKIVLDVVLQHTGNFGEDTLCPLFQKDYTQPLSDINSSLVLHDNSRLDNSYFSLASSAQYSARLAQMKNTDGVNHDSHNYWHHYGSGWNWDEPNRVWGQIAGDCVDLNTEHPAVVDYLAQCYGSFIAMGVDAFRIDTGGHIARLAFTNGFIPKFQELGEKYKHKRLNDAPFFMFAEVCARYSEATYRGNDCLSPYYYTWAPDKEYAWDPDPASWDSQVIMEGYLGSHVNTISAEQEMADYMGTGHYTSSSSDNALLNGNAYHTPDYSKASGMSVIDFTMHWNFGSASQAFGVKKWDGMYNDATYNVVYVDSHDYGPDSFGRYDGGTAKWAENMSLMFTFRGIPCLYYGSEVEFRKGVTIDEGANLALNNSGRAYYGGYITGDVTPSDFGQWTSATGNAKATLTSPLAIHLGRLSRIRAAVPALRKGQYSTSGCSGSISFKRRYTDSVTDSYCLVTISGNATFTGIENGTYTDCVTGDVKTVTDNTLTATCSGTGNMRVYVLSTSLTPAPGKIGDDTEYLYTSSAVKTTQASYDGQQEAMDYDTVKYTSDGSVAGGDVEEPETTVAPSMSEGEQAVFFEDPDHEWGWIKCYAWYNGINYFGSWSGTTMQYLGNYVWKITYTGSQVIPDGKAGVIFTNGTSQTANWTWYNGGYYTREGGFQRVIEGAGMIDEEPVTEPIVYIDGLYRDVTETCAYFENDSSWSGSIYCWCWNLATTSTNYTGGSWPGVACTNVKDNIWKWTYTEALEDYAEGIIFSAAGSPQTKDMTFINGGYYTSTGGYQGVLAYEGQNVISIVEIPAVESMPVYYNMQGLRVTRPVAGQVYIRVVGNQAEKIVKD